jgi:hypothetical protein
MSDFPWAAAISVGVAWIVVSVLMGYLGAPPMVKLFMALLVLIYFSVLEYRRRRPPN